MIRVDPPITDPSKWAFRGAIDYQPDGTNRTGLKILPASFATPFVRIKTIAEEVPGRYKKPPEHWFLSGNLTIVYGTFRDLRSVRIPLNADSVYSVEPIVSPFQLGFDAVDWLPSLTVEFYEWISAITIIDLTSIKTLLDPIEDAIYSIQDYLTIGTGNLTDPYLGANQ